MKYIFMTILFCLPLRAQNNYIDDVEINFYDYLEEQMAKHEQHPKLAFSELVPQLWDNFIRSHFFDHNQFKFAMPVRLFGLITTDYEDFFYTNSGFLKATRELNTNFTITVNLINTLSGYTETEDLKISSNMSELFQASSQLETKAKDFYSTQIRKNPKAEIIVEFPLSLDKYGYKEISPFLQAIERRMKRGLQSYAIDYKGTDYMLNSLKNIAFKDLPTKNITPKPHPVESTNKLSESLSVLSSIQDHVIDWNKDIIVRATNLAGYQSELIVKGSLIGWDLNQLPGFIREKLSENRGYYIDRITEIELPFLNQIYERESYYSRILKNPLHESLYVKVLEDIPAILYTQVKDSFFTFSKLPAYNFNLSKARSSSVKINFYDTDPNVGSRYTETDKDNIMNAIHSFSMAPPVDNIQMRNCKALFLM